jgi:eukaryotic-like serine/threonine-protein kinase
MTTNLDVPPLEAPTRSRLGAVLGQKYRLDRVLGSGAMATVYAATHRNGKEVAVKLLHPELACRADVRTRFLREGYVANHVRHSGAVAVLDDDVTEDGWAFLVMELLDGVTLQELWATRGPHVHPACVCAITLQLLSVMAAAHARGIVHRDLKPANLFVVETGELKVLDFGIACMCTAGSRTTDFGTVLGTPEFMAPEQALGQAAEVDAKTDLWAVGAIAYALLVGEVVHPAETPEETLIYAATLPASLLGPLVLGLPAAIARVFDRALAFERGARWASAGQMRDALASAAKQAYGEVPGRAAIRAALSRRMMEHRPAQETLEFLSDDVAGDLSATTASPANQATLLGLAGAPPSPSSRQGVPSLRPVSTEPALDGASRRAPSQVRRARQVAGVAIAGALSLTLLVSRILSPVTASASSPARVSAATPMAVVRAAPLGVTDAAADGDGWSTIITLPQLVPVLAPPRVAEPAVVAPPPVATPARSHFAPHVAPHAASPSRSVLGTAPSDRCTPPFAFEPATGIKRWKVDCL